MAFDTVLTIIEIIIRIASFVLGMVTVAATLYSAVRTFVLPRAQNDFLLRRVARTIRQILNLYMRWRGINTYEGRDRVMAFFAPVTLLAVPVVWIVYIMLGYMFIYWALGVRPWAEAFAISGSSLLTLGSTPFINTPITIIQFSEAILGLGMVALLIAYLPTMYSSFARREAAVAMLVVRAGSPPSGVEMIKRFHRIHGLHELRDMWEEWEVWFTELEESHTSLSALAFFRSPQPENSWVTAAGTILDTAALLNSTVDVPQEPDSQLCIRAGSIALRRIAGFYFYPYDPDPHFPKTPISITQEEFDAAYDELMASGVPLKPDREDCWQHYAGWRVNYDEVLLFLADMTMAPYAPWVSDRGRPITTQPYRPSFRKPR